MPIETTHPDYNSNIGIWTRCRDCYDGEDAIKEGALTYLPRIDPNQTGAEYAAYCGRAQFHPAFGHTVNGLTGSIARREHVIELPTAMQSFTSDVTASGVGVDEFVKLMAKETLITGRNGILVDFDEAKQRSFLSLYTAESITNWGDFGVVLKETVFVTDPVDRFKLKPIVQYRQLSVEDGAYTVTIWRKSDAPIIAVGQEQFVIYRQEQPKVRGLDIGGMPFFWISFLGRTNQIVNPPLLDWSTRV